jgi:hypothetical protein
MTALRRAAADDRASPRAAADRASRAAADDCAPPPQAAAHNARAAACGTWYR